MKGHAHVDISCTAARQVLNVGRTGWKAVHKHGIFWHTPVDGGDGALTIVFKPTGVSFDDRPENINELYEYSSRYRFRFSLENRKQGPGAGGLEILSHKTPLETIRPSSRMMLLAHTSWNEVEMGEDVGSIGWVPRELTKPVRPLLHDHPYAITHLATAPNRHSFHSRDRPSVLLVLAIWRLSPGLIKGISADLMEGYKLLERRTGLEKWHKAGFMSAWVLTPGYEGQEVAD